LVAYTEVSNDVEAQAIADKVYDLAVQMSKDAKDRFNQYCRNSLEQAEAKGIDSDELPEVDGEETYWVTVESMPGSMVRQGTHSYE
jgi:hypothetical protein